MKEYTIYFLMSRLTGKIFYVGMTTKPLHIRLGGHIGESKQLAVNEAKSAIIKEAGKNGITIHEIETILCDKDAAANRESFWISQFMRHGYILTNKFKDSAYSKYIYDNEKNNIKRVGDITCPFYQFIYQTTKLIAEV